MTGRDLQSADASISRCRSAKFYDPWTDVLKFSCQSFISW